MLVLQQECQECGIFFGAERASETISRTRFSSTETSMIFIRRRRDTSVSGANKKSSASMAQRDAS